MKQLTFSFNEQPITVLILDGNSWFLGSQVCKILDITNTGNAYSRLKDYEKTIHSTDGISNPNTIYISESGLYRLILKSRKPQAEAFQDWVCQEVLPSIRDTGSYSLPTSKPLTPAQMLLQQAQFMVDMEQRQAKLEASQAATHTIALEAKHGLNQVRDQLASLKEFAVAQPPGLPQDQADLINQAFQLLGATLLETGVLTDKSKAYSTPWRDLGLTMRNSSINYDLNARYSNAIKTYQKELANWETNGKPRGSKPKKPSRIALLVRDNVLTDGFKAAQQVVTSNLAKLIK